MRNLIPFLALLLCFSVTSALYAGNSENDDEELLYYWHFNDWDAELPILSDFEVDGLEQATITGNLVEGAFGTASVSTDINAQFGEGSDQSFYVRGAASLANNGKHLQLNLSTTGYEQIVLRYAARTTDTGFQTQPIEFLAEHNNGDFIEAVVIDFHDIAELGEFGPVEVLLSSLSDVENASIRLIFEGASGALGRTNIDNLTIHGVPIEGEEEDKNGDDAECPVPSIQETDASAETRTITLQIDDPNGIEEVHFSDPDNNNNSGLFNLEVKSFPAEYFEMDTDGEYFTVHNDEEAPVQATFVLQATEMEGPVDVGYFVTATNTCGTTATNDPPHAFGPHSDMQVVLQHYPNPFQESVTITYGLAEAGPATLQVFDTLGRLVATLVEGQREAGEHFVQWNGEDQSGRPVASGLYVLRMEANDRIKTQRLVRVR